MQAKLIKSRLVVAWGQERKTGKYGREGFQSGPRKFWRIIDMFITLIIMMVL